MEYLSPRMDGGIARNASQSLFPQLWQGLFGFYSPGLGVQGNTLYDFAGLAGNAPFTVISPAVAPTLTWVGGPNGGYGVNMSTAVNTSGDQMGFATPAMQVPTSTGGTYFLNNAKGYTIGFWAKVASFGTAIQFFLATNGFVNGGNGSHNNGASGWADSAGAGYWFVQSSGAINFNGWTGVSVSSYADSKWHYWTIVMTPTGTGTTANQNLYIDGKFLGSQSGTSLAWNTNAGGMTLEIGGYGNVGGGAWTLGDFGMWGRALTAPEIALLADGASPLHQRLMVGAPYPVNLVAGLPILVTPAALTLTAATHAPGVSSSFGPYHISAVLHAPLVYQGQTVTPSTLNIPVHTNIVYFGYDYKKTIGGALPLSTHLYNLNWTLSGGQGSLPWSILSDNPFSTATASSFGTSTYQFPPSKVFSSVGGSYDGNTFESWYATGAVPQYVELDLGLGYQGIINLYGVIQGSNGSTNGFPTNWQFQGSNDNSTWTTLDTRSGQSGGGAGVMVFYTPSTTGKYRYYRMNITAIGAGGSLATLGQIAGWGTLFSPVNIVASPSILSFASAVVTPTFKYDYKVKPSRINIVSAPHGIPGIITFPSVLTSASSLHAPSEHVDFSAVPTTLNVTSAIVSPSYKYDYKVSQSAIVLHSTLQPAVVGPSQNPAATTLTMSMSLHAPSIHAGPVFTPTTLNITATVNAPTVKYGWKFVATVLTLASGHPTPTRIGNFRDVLPTVLTLTSTLRTPTTKFAYKYTVPAALALNLGLQTPTPIDLGTGAFSFATKMLFYSNKLIIVSNQSPMQMSVVNIATPTAPTETKYTIPQANSAFDVAYNSTLNRLYVACASGKIVEFNSLTFAPTINATGTTNNLTSIATLPLLFEVYAGSNQSTGELVEMWEGTAVQLASDIRFSATVNANLGTYVNTVQGSQLATDLRFSATVNTILGCDIRFIDESFADLALSPIARTDFHLFINDVECTDVKLDSIEITHTADQKSEATFILARKHDSIDYMLDGTHVPVTGHPTVKISIDGNQEFGYNTPAYIWDIDTKSETESVVIKAYSELPQQDERSTITVSLPSLNEKLHVYHALVDNPTIENPFVLADDINPATYLGILIDNGYTRIENVTQFKGFSSISQTQDQKVNYVFGSGDSGVLDIHGNNVYFAPYQNWTYFWFAHATNFITGDTWTGLLNNGSSYIGTSPSALTSKSWDVDYIDWWYQRKFPDTEYRGTKGGGGSATVYPSDFLGVVSVPYSPDALDAAVGIDPFNGNTTVDAILRDHTPQTISGAQILAAKQRLTVVTNPGSSVTTINGITYLITITGELVVMPRNMSTKILDVIDSKFGVTFGSAPYKKVSAKSGVYTPAAIWEDTPNGLFTHKAQGYDYTNYVNAVGAIELEKLENINGSVLPKTKCDIEMFPDGYYHYGVALLKRVNIDNTTTANIYNGNNGFPVSVKTIHISAKTMRVTLNCTNEWSRLELLELEGQIPDPYFSLIPETISEYSPKFDPNSLQNIN